VDSDGQLHHIWSWSVGYCYKFVEEKRRIPFCFDRRFRSCDWSVCASCGTSELGENPMHVDSRSGRCKAVSDGWSLCIYDDSP
jgi:hypothetical protein